MGYFNEVTAPLSAKEEVELIGELLHDCHVFLQTWKVLIGDRAETTQDAFIAVTELESELRARRKFLAVSLGMDVVPF